MPQVAASGLRGRGPAPEVALNPIAGAELDRFIEQAQGNGALLPLHRLAGARQQVLWASDAAFGVGSAGHSKFGAPSSLRRANIRSGAR